MENAFCLFVVQKVQVAFFLYRKIGSSVFFLLPVVESYKDPGSDRQCMSDHMTKLFGDSVLILVLPFVWVWTLRPRPFSGGLFYVQISDVATKCLQLRTSQPLLLNLR